MSILVGIKQVQTSGSFHGAEGFESISMNGTQFHLLREDTHNELVHYVEKIREDAKKASEEYDELEDKMEMLGGEMSNEQFNKFVEMADAAMQSKNYTLARFNYNKALTLRPNEKYPKDQLKKLKELMEAPKAQSN